MALGLNPGSGAKFEAIIFLIILISIILASFNKVILAGIFGVFGVAAAAIYFALMEKAE